VVLKALPSGDDGNVALTITSDVFDVWDSRSRLQQRPRKLTRSAADVFGTSGMLLGMKE
jgi:hypothetical protein